MSELKENLSTFLTFDPTINPKDLSAVNLSPIEITKDQLIQLYLMLYPMIVADFMSRGDIYKWEKNINDEMKSKFSQLSQDLTKHKHIGNMGSPTSPPVEPISIAEWQKHPEDADYKDGENMITSNSKYSTSIEHRDPTKEQTGVNHIAATPISVQYNTKLIYVPFDIDINSTEYGDGEYAG